MRPCFKKKKNLFLKLWHLKHFLENHRHWLVLSLHYMWWEWDLQLSVNPTNSSVISSSEPLRELFGWIWLGVAVIGPQEIKGLLTNIFQK